MNTSNNYIAKSVIENISRDDLRRIAKAINAPSGGTKNELINSICNAIDNGKLHCKAIVTLSFKKDKNSQRENYFVGTFRNYVSGENKGNEVFYCINKNT